MPTSRLRRALQALWIVVGLVLLGVGLIGFLLPTHILGIPFVVVGLGLVLRNSISWRRRFVRYQRRYPNLVHPVRRLLRHEILPVLWQQVLRSERLLPSRWRRLRRIRRRMNRRREASVGAKA